MTRKETRWLVGGMLIGMLAVSAVAAGLWLRFQRNQTAEASPTPPVASEPVPAAAPTSGATDEAVQLSPDEQTKIGLQTESVRRESVTEDIVAIGRVEEPETSIGTISTRFGGRLEHLFVNFIGQPVQKGDPVATVVITSQPVMKDDPVSSIYSRELIAAAEEYKFALENRQHAHASSRADAQAQADALVDASRVRLQRWGLTSEQIDGLLASPEQPIRVTIYAEVSGLVRLRKVTEGQFVNAGDALIDLTNLSTVWVKADVFDADIARIRPGLMATITSEALPGTKVTGTVDFMDTHSDPQTRTTPIRIAVDNPGTRLKPGMVVQSTFHSSLGSMLTIPRDAVIDTGVDKVVYLARDNGVFQKRRIQVGLPFKERYPVTEGLANGDKVVTNGVFLVDSQTRLTGGLTGLFGGSKSFAETSTPTAAGNGAFKMTFRIDPDPPMGGKENTMHVSLVDAAGKPVRDAQVHLTFVMPAMPSMHMPEMRNGGDLKWNGSEYAGPIQILMAGGWSVAIEARRGSDLLTTYKTQLNAH